MNHGSWAISFKWIESGKVSYDLLSEVVDGADIDDV